MITTMFFDLTPDLCDIPPETWSGIDAEGVSDYMISRVPDEIDTGTMSLRALATAVRVPRISDSVRAMTWLSPKLVQILDRQFERQESEVGE
jgi:hypothetical protein